MITRVELRRIARARLRDAEVLFAAGRYDGAAYLCGYAVELAFKARICRTLRSAEFPSTAGDFSDYRSFRTHDLTVLLRLSGIHDRIRRSHHVQWSVVPTWDPESRYNPIGTANRATTLDLIASTGSRS
jgi:HEPN domain-containing protein